MLKNINDELLLMLGTECVRSAPERPAGLGCCFIYFFFIRDILAADWERRRTFGESVGDRH